MYFRRLLNKLTKKLRAYSAAIVIVLASANSTEAIAGDELMAFTPSGRADMIFYDETTAVAADKLANVCFDRGMAVTEQAERRVTCEVNLDDVQSVLTQLLLGNSHSTRPQQFVSFNLVRSVNGARVQASSWIEISTALGQLQRQPLRNDDHQNGMMQFMLAAGGGLVTRNVLSELCLPWGALG